MKRKHSRKKVIVDPKNDQILGAAILGIEGGEVMAVLQMAMMGQVPYTAIRDGVFAPWQKTVVSSRG